MHEGKEQTHSLPISHPSPAILQIFPLTLTLLLASICKFTQQGLWGHCTGGFKETKLYERLHSVS